MSSVVWSFQATRSSESFACASPFVGGKINEFGHQIGNQAFIRIADVLVLCREPFFGQCCRAWFSYQTATLGSCRNDREFAPQGGSPTGLLFVNPIAAEHCLCDLSQPPVFCQD